MLYNEAGWVDDVIMRRRPRDVQTRPFAVAVTPIVLFALIAGCSSERLVTVAAGDESGSTNPTEPVVTTVDPTTIASSTTVPSDTATTVAPTGSRGPNDCVPPQQFRDIDGDGMGVCFRPDGAPQAPTGDHIVNVPGSTNVVDQTVNATVDISSCRGNGVAGTITIEGELANFGDTIDRGSINLHMLDVDGVMATVAARVASVAGGVSVPLDFGTLDQDSPARTLGEVQACWFDSISDVTFFTIL
jgi:hypothetical protein